MLGGSSETYAGGGDELTLVGVVRGFISRLCKEGVSGRVNPLSSLGMCGGFF